MEVAQASRLHLDKWSWDKTAYRPGPSHGVILRIGILHNFHMLWAQGYVRQAISSSPRPPMYVNNTCPVTGLFSGADTARTSRKIKSLTAGKVSTACSSSSIRTV